jgi:hypothetical protein
MRLSARVRGKEGAALLYSMSAAFRGCHFSSAAVLVRACAGRKKLNQKTKEARYFFFHWGEAGAPTCHRQACYIFAFTLPLSFPQRALEGMWICRLFLLPL